MHSRKMWGGNQKKNKKRRKTNRWGRNHPLKQLFFFFQIRVSQKVCKYSYLHGKKKKKLKKVTLGRNPPKQGYFFQFFSFFFEFFEPSPSASYHCFSIDFPDFLYFDGMARMATVVSIILLHLRSDRQSVQCFHFNQHHLSFHSTLATHQINWGLHFPTNRKPNLIFMPYVNKICISLVLQSGSIFRRWGF